MPAPVAAHYLILQCFCPSYEGLLSIPADNCIILDLGFVLATWHALAKLREHTTLTVDGLDASTIDCGRSVRLFAKKTCNNYVTLELPSKDNAARTRRKAASTKIATAQAPRKRKTYNYTTYKFHGMRDFAPAIRSVSATDNFNTQIGELEHRHVKRYYARTNKINAGFQIAQHMRRAEKLRVIKLRVDAWRARSLPYVEDPRERYHVANSQRDHQELTAWVSEHHNDCALQDFITELKNHVLCRLDPARARLGVEFTPKDRARVLIRNNRMYSHQVCRVNYTTYDRQRSQDSINPRTHSDILLLAPKRREGPGADHPYLYARVIKVLHINVCLVDTPGSEFDRVDVLWVRWFRLDPSFTGGFETKRLHRLQFVPIDSQEDSFGFIDPCDIVRGAHLIPAFTHGRTADLLAGPTVARQEASSEEDRNTDFKYHYVNIFVDRDMFMRYYGGGIGHHGLRTPGEVCYANEDDEDNDESSLGPSSAHLNASSPPLDPSLQRSRTPEGDQFTEEVHCEEDILRMVPELQARARSSSMTAEHEEEEGLGGCDEDLDSEDEELMASADLPDMTDERSQSEGNQFIDSEPGPGSDDEDEYGLEEYAPL
ncbi:hypothetical protein BN946_scf184912.g62 [Trametes cinnabarina]|uniref:Uncharacterized protein n=1 Tax=Pycnoporus cinnabarinus TaxID=5643 RepID=A0A060SYC8_PYCCI|nr:hypothetical protein BN946_scf184912.g62 [Trametes cinnabarina]